MKYEPFDYRVMTSLFTQPNDSSSPSVPFSKEKGYLVFARKWRPKTFEEVMGQDVLLTILQNAFATKRLGHAFLFAGQRGVGKTTTARLLARAFNCIGSDGSGQETMKPCGECSPCREILEERSLDVLEMDAASHTSVEDIRDIIEGARYKPVSLRYKIYIIDEVHMLSKSAFNALLKTLEEPPPHVKFIFATTETNKVPVTILSRCQRFDLRRFSLEHLEKLLTQITEKEGLKAEPEAIRLIALAADGSARDSLSLLEQAFNLVEAEKNDGLEASSVRSMLGILESEKVFQIFKAIVEGNTKELLSLTSHYFEQGGTPVLLLKDMQEILYTTLRLKLERTYEGSFRLAEEKETLLRYAQTLSSGYLHQAWQIVTKGAEEIHFSPVPAYAAEMVLLRLMFVTDLSLFEKFEKSVISAPALQKQESKQEKIENVSQAQNKEVSSFHTLEEILAFLLEHKEIGLYTILYQQAQLVELQDPSLTIWLPEEVGKTKFIPSLVKTLSSLTGRTWVVKLGEKPQTLSIQEKEKAFEQARLLEAGQQPLVQKVLETFPDARLERVVEEG